MDSNKFLARALSQLKPGAIMVCDSCDAYVLKEHVHTHIGSMSKEYSICPECDLPAQWHSNWSEKRQQIYFVHMNPLTNKRFCQWSHPTPGNPLYNKNDPGEKVTKKRKTHSKT